MRILDACFSSSELLDRILSWNQTVIIVTDPEGSIIHANPPVERTLGFSPQELEGQGLSLFFTSEDRSYLYPNLLYMARNRQVFEGEVMLIRKDATRFFAHLVVRSFQEPLQEKRINAIYIQDIEKEKQLQRALRGVHYDDLIKVASGIAHELRNPLVGIGGFVTRLYKSCRATEDDDRYYEHVISNVRKIEELVKKVHFFARLPKPYFTEEPLREIVEKALQPYLQEMVERKIALSMNIEEMILTVDRELLTKVFSILTRNALDALAEGGRLLVHGETKENTFEIRFTDTGRGIVSKDLPYIFNPFFSTKADGAGIDLATAKLIMDSHGGTIEATSPQGEGATFLLQLPLERRRSIRLFRLE